MKRNLTLVLFFAVFAFNLVAVTIGDTTLEAWTKALLMPTLIIYMFSAIESRRSLVGLAVAALALSWVGDCLLLADRSFGSLFVPGLLFFLAAHIIYIIHFLKLKKAAGIRTWPNIIVVVLIALYALGLIYSLKPHLGPMLYPVAIYAVVISCMFASSISAIPKGGARYASAGVVGALLFLTSDSILAINKFATPIDFSMTITMLTYGLAQFMIAEGAIFSTQEIKE